MAAIDGIPEAIKALLSGANNVYELFLSPNDVSKAPAVPPAGAAFFKAASKNV